MYHRIPKRFAITMLSASLIMVLLLVVVLATANRPIPTKPDALTGRCITPDCVGTFLHETALNTSNVNVNQFGLLFRRKVDGHIYTRPLYVPAVEIPGKGIHNVIYIATQHNTVYAFDADDPDLGEPLWQVNLGPPIPLPDENIGPAYYGDIQIEVGVTGTPVIDLEKGIIYLVAATRESDTGSCPCQYPHRIHALDLRTGQEQLGGPVDIHIDLPQTGDATFIGERQLQRVALLLSRGVLYIGFGSYGDRTPYHGWLLGYDAQTLKQVSTFNSTPAGNQGGIWMGGLPPTVDSDGNLYLVVANGSFDGDSAGNNFGMSILRFDPSTLVNSTPKIVDWFSPFDHQSLIDGDVGLGSTGAILLPRNRVLAGTKNGQLILLDRNHLTHTGGPEGDSPLVQRFQVSWGPMFSSPIYWAGPQGERVYVWGTSDALKVFRYDGYRIDPTPEMTSTVVLTDVWPGGILTLSANGSQPGTGIVWANHPIRNANEQTAEGILRAYDAQDITHELWNSEINRDRDHLGSFGKFTPATVVNGKVYVATFSNDLNVYGLLPKSD